MGPWFEVLGGLERGLAACVHSRISAGARVQALLVSLSAENGRSEPQIARRGAVCQSNAAQDAQGDFGRTAAPGPRVGMAYATVVAGHST